MRSTQQLEVQINQAMKDDRWDEAIARAEVLAALQRRAQGDKHFETVNAALQVETLRQIAARPKADRSAYLDAITLNAQGKALLGQGKSAEAQPLFQKALEINRRLLGEDNPTTGTSYENVAENLRELARTAEAQPLYQKALEIRLRLPGRGSSRHCGKLQQPGSQPRPSGEVHRSPNTLEKALEIQVRLLGEDHPDTAGIYNNLAMNLNAPGEVRRGPAPPPRRRWRSAGES